LRVWGDGLAYLDAWLPASSNDANWSGRLSASQVRDMLGYLANQGYLNNWTPAPGDIPNAVGTYLSLGVHLNAGSIEHGSADGSWPVYADFAARLKAELSPLTVGPDTDPRIAGLFAPNCTTPTVPPTVDVTATVAVLETQQPPGRAQPFEGLCECVPASLPTFGLLAQNSWQRRIGSQPVLVVAGAFVAALERGGLAVTRDQGRTWLTFTTPAAAGSVRITAEEHNRLTLRSQQGSTFYFDVPSLSFADSLTQIIPTALPPTPYPGPGTPPRPTAYP
jgi:hypothetical protein